MNRMKSSELSFLKKILFVFFAIFIFFIISELLIRVIFPQFNYNNINYEKDINHRIFKGEDTYFTKNKISKNFLIRVQKKGETFNIDDNKKKIIFIGDSVTLGLGVKFEETFVEKFKSNFFDQNTQIISFSNIGINSEDIFDSITKELTSILKGGDTVVYQFNYNDITIENSYKDKFKNDTIFDYFQKIKFRYLNHSTLVKYLNHHFSLIFKKINGSCVERQIESLGQYSYSYFSKGFEKESETLWKKFEKRMTDTKKILDKNKIDFFILISPISLQLQNHQKINKLNLDLSCGNKNAYAHLKELINKYKIGLIDPLKRFEYSQLKKFQLLFHSFDDNHPNKYGHRLLAEELYNELSKHYK